MEFREKSPLYLLKEIAEILRSENGCVWDREQTISSLKPYLIEETYEVYDAIEKNNKANLREELGDLIYQVYAISQIAEEENSFNIDDVVLGIIEKLIRRHPHVFGTDKVSSSAEVTDKWEKIKKKEKKKGESILDGVPRNLPSLLMAYRVQEKAARIGFDWKKIDDALPKLHEELDELKAAILERNDKKVIEESGDILFSIVNLYRFLKINPEEALRNSTDKFIERFRSVEHQAALSGRTIDSMTLAELDILWENAKKPDDNYKS